MIISLFASDEAHPFRLRRYLVSDVRDARLLDHPRGNAEVFHDDPDFISRANLVANFTLSSDAKKKSASVGMTPRLTSPAPPAWAIVSQRITPGTTGYSGK